MFFFPQSTSQNSPLRYSWVSWPVPSQFLLCVDAVCRHCSCQTHCGGTYRRLHSPHSLPGKFLSGNLWKIFSGRLYTLWWELCNVLLRQLVCCSSRPNKDRPLFLLKKRAVKTRHHSPAWRESRWRDVICLIFFPTAESCWQQSSCYVSYSAAEHDRLEDMSAFKKPRWSGLTSVKMNLTKKENSC